MEVLDVRLFHLVYDGTPHPKVYAVMVALTLLGSGWFLVALAPLLLAARTRRFALWVLGSAAGTATVVGALKSLVARPRPFRALLAVVPRHEAPADFSFPSGHAAGSFAVATFLATALLLHVAPPDGDRRRRQGGPPSGPGRRAAAAVAAFALVAVAFAISLSRVYLGVHFPSDVAGGAALGGVVGGMLGRRFVRYRSAP